MIKGTPKKIKVDKNSKCDFCDKKMKYMGANSITSKIHRACEQHKDEVAKALKAEREQNDNN